MKYPTQWFKKPEAEGRPVHPCAKRRHRLYFGETYCLYDWEAHMSHARFGRALEPAYLARVLTVIAVPLILVTSMTVGCGLYEGLRPRDWISLNDLDGSFGYSLVSFAISLLLVFKTNTAYARFWEARTAWGTLFTWSRTFMMRLLSYTDGMPLQQRQFFVRWVSAFPYLMRTHLYDYAHDVDDATGGLWPSEVAYLKSASQHWPSTAAAVLSKAIGRLELKGPIHADMMNLLQSFMLSCGVCERISRTPIPMAYSRHTTRFLLAYLLFLPLAVWSQLRWATLAIAPLVGFLLTGVENISVMLENPMLSLPMETYCSAIRRDVEELGARWAAGAEELDALVTAAWEAPWKSPVETHDSNKGVCKWDPTLNPS